MMKAGRILWMLAIFLVLSSVVQAQTDNPAANYSLGADRIARMEQIIDSFANAKQFMGDVLVAEDGRVVLDKSYGFANVEWQVPNTPESKFRLGSITKQFTAASILQLEHQGKLGYLIEKISGKTYAQFVRENIFDPLGMKDTGYDSFTQIIPHRATGYINGSSGIENARYIDMTIPLSAGALYSTTHDLLKWEQGLFGARLLDATELKKMTTPFKHDYACGLMILKGPDGHQMITHGGGIEGFNTALAYYPDNKLTIIALANLNGGAPDEIVDKLGRTAYGEKVVLPAERKEIAVDRAVLAGYVGTYKLAPDFDIAITLEGAQLMAQATRQPKFPLFAESPTKFFLKVVDAQVEFFKENGRVTYLVLHQNGHDTKGIKQ